MSEIKIDEALWASSIFPRVWSSDGLFPTGATVAAGHAIAEVRIEDALHEITAPASGPVTIVAAENSVVDPGALLATLD